METLGKWTMGATFSLLGLVAPIRMLIVSVVVFVLFDFVTGNIADYYRNRRAGTKYYFQSHKAWLTIWKLGFVMIAIYLAWNIDVVVLHFMPDLHLPELLTAFVCGVEFWSFLENAAEISQHPIFRWINRFTKDKLRDKAQIDIEKYKRDDDHCDPIA